MCNIIRIEFPQMTKKKENEMQKEAKLLVQFHLFTFELGMYFFPSFFSLLFIFFETQSCNRWVIAF